ncbi:glucosamine-6-phosphate deaminase [Flavihumibacter sp. UBA7668]|uniref:glucosamine-6-phosphate deaminase n=1 Tax=Flavihumibacter sp. UBA7668 TaxID=1946542 RepID=UPI0025BC234D|nr:glucosamine-6-phosphate deaminase [Flavihumibacter sp. UBA7668]
MEILTYTSRNEMGIAAASMVADKVRDLQQSKPLIYMMFAAAPSQLDFLDAFVQEELNWKGIIAFHMDEYIGLPESHPASFRNFLNRHLFGKVEFGAVHLINGDSSDAQMEAERYAALLEAHPPDIICLGIGENTHLAFNDPHVADFNDPVLVKRVDLDLACRQQQVNDGCFKQMNEVPEYALTVTLPGLYRGQFLYCMVPGKNKAKAVYQTMMQEISPIFPSTLLRMHPQVVLFLDEQSATLLPSK